MLLPATGCDLSDLPRGPMSDRGISDGAVANDVATSDEGHSSGAAWEVDSISRKATITSYFSPNVVGAALCIWDNGTTIGSVDHVVDGSRTSLNSVCSISSREGD